MSGRRPVRRRGAAATLAALALAVAAVTSCHRGRGRERVPDPAWVEIHHPRAAWQGYNLVLFERHTPMLIDMNGALVHRWRIDASSRARLLPDGHLLTIGTDGVVREVDWEGEPVWEHRLPGEDFPHHDLIALENGNRLVLAHDPEESLDYLLELTTAGEVRWEWRARIHLAEDLERARARGERGNLTHINSIRELPENPWFDAGDERFRPGNILLSARNLNTLYVVDRRSGEVTWRYDRDLDHQHEATMIPRGFPGEGRILVFNNGLENRLAYRQSSIEEIDPTTGTVVWSYRAPEFFSSTGGTQQALANGNVLVTSSRGGRMFEIDREGTIVWQWAPPYQPIREVRYPRDQCPQLAALPSPRPARRQVERRHVDRDLYDFDLGLKTERVEIAGHKRRVLKQPEACVTVFLPERPRLVVGLGRRPSTAAGQAPVTATMRLAPVVDGAPDAAAGEVLLERSVGPAEDPEAGRLERAEVELAGHALEWVEICLVARGGNGDPPDPSFVWQTPVIQTDVDAGADSNDRSGPGKRDQAFREKQLRAMGYVD